MSFGGDTEILTREGPRYIKDVKSEYLYVSTLGEMKWIKCDIKNFGQQVTVPIRFGSPLHETRVTLSHDWFYWTCGKYKLDHRKKKKTYELRQGRGGELFSLARIKLSEIDPKGVAHGFIFGDGHQTNIRGKLSCRVILFKNDKDLIGLLSRYGNIGSAHVEFHGYLPTVNSLPEDWKELPHLPTKEYALGFILGLISADGHISKGDGTITISQSDWEDIVEFRRLAIYTGLRAREITLCNFPDEETFENSKQRYILPIGSYNLTQDHFLRHDQKKNFKVKIKQYTTIVTSIDFDDKITEEVFCPVVPSYQIFTLANWVITGSN